MISIFKSGKVNEKFFSSKSYRSVSKIIVVAYVLLAFIYAFRDNLYKINNEYITLFAETAPNLIASSIFTIIGMFYILPFLKGMDSINKSAFLWLINILNIIVFLFIEYIHVVLDLGTWDNNDIVASLIGVVFSTVIYFKTRRNFL